MAKKDLGGMPTEKPIELTYVFVGQPSQRQFDVFDEEGMVRVIPTAKVSNPSGGDYGGTLQDLLDAIAERGWKPGPTFSCGVEKNVWILWREKVA